MEDGRRICALHTSTSTTKFVPHRTVLPTPSPTPRTARRTYLVVTTTVRVVYWVHGNATSAGPRVALSTHSVVLATSLEEGLVDTATTGGNTDGSTGTRGDGLLGARGETDTGLAVLGVADDGGVVARGASKSSAVADLLLDVEDDGTLGALSEREDVADGESGLLAGVDERAGREALSRDEGLLAELVAVGVTEDDGREGSATVWLVQGSKICPRSARATTLSTLVRGAQRAVLSPAPQIAPSSLPPCFVLPAAAPSSHPTTQPQLPAPSPLQSQLGRATHRPASWMISRTTPRT